MVLGLSSGANLVTIIQRLKGNDSQESRVLVNASNLSEARIQEMACTGALLRRAFDKSVCMKPTASAAITAGALQVVVSKARENTVLGHAPCSFALPIDL